MVRKNSLNRKSKKPGGSRIAALAISTVIILAVIGYLVVKHNGSISSRVIQTAKSPPLPLLKLKPLPLVAGNYSTPEKKVLHQQSSPNPSVQLEKKCIVVNTSSSTGRLAIIIDDMGTSMQEAHSLANIGVPLTFSIIPGLRSYREVAAFADSSGIETMIHIPMQSKGWPERRLEPRGLLVSMDKVVIGGRLEEFMHDIPTAVGANNHMGSEFTEHEDKMQAVLTELKSKGLFFIDSVTTPRSVGMRVARELGIKTGKRSVFLDNEQDGLYIRGQLKQAVLLAKKNGAAIAIGHPHPITIQTLEAELNGLAKQGITLVPASKLVR